MRNPTRNICVVLAVSLLALAGCAKEEVVKKDEPVMQQQTVKQQAPQQQVPVTAPTTATQSSNQSEASATKASAASSLETVYFDFDRSDLRQDSRDALSKNAQTLLNTLTTAKVKIEGNCDERGSDEYNLALGERRAKSAAAYLITMGVKSDRISTISYGKEKPAVQGNDEAAWSKNRRDEFVIVK